jgi:pyridoxal phosphate enzyme (YggS family)
MRWVAQTMRLAALVPPGRQCGLRHNGLVRCCSTGTAGVSEALEDVRGRLSTVSTEAGLSKPVSIDASNAHAARPRLMVRLLHLAQPRLVAVSKTKPADLLIEAYEAGQRDFGENYVQELIEKAPLLPADTAWRFIGKLQSNKAKALVQGVPGLVAVETLTTTKLADKLQTAAAAAQPPRAAPLEVYVQVDTSPWEGTKNGVGADEAADVAAHVAAKCPALRLAGLMTIGAPGDASCFDALRECRETVAARLGVPPDALELSMGMSGDFEAAARAGSTSVRVGSSIFGARAYPPKA